MFPVVRTGLERNGRVPVREMIGICTRVRDIAVQHLHRLSFWLNSMQTLSLAYFVCTCFTRSPVIGLDRPDWSAKSER
jgi:hypothetical protein